MLIYLALTSLVKSNPEHCATFSPVDNELEDILSCDEEVLQDVFQWWVPPLRRIPPLLWVRIRSELAPYLVERGLEGGAPVLTWYHRQFSETAAEVGKHL